MISITDGLQAIYNSNMREKTPLELEREVRQLTNNWNELEEWAKSEKERFREIAINQGLFIDKELSMRIDTRIKLIDSILDKMKEIKGDKN